MTYRAETSWRCVILGYAVNGESKQVLEFYDRMEHDNSSDKPHPQIFVAALKACGVLASKPHASKKCFLDKGKAIHLKAMEHGLDKNMFIESTLVDMYAKCGSMDDALAVFEDARNRKSVVLWNCIILGYAEYGQCDFALELYSRMLDENIQPSHVTILATLKACSSLAEREEAMFVHGKFVKVSSLEKGMQVHLHAKISGDGILETTAVGNSLVDFYAKCGSMKDAGHIFDNMLKRTVVSWTAMIWGHAENNEGQQALEVYSRMKDEGFVPDAVTYVAALKAAGCLVSLETGKRIHVEILKTGFQVVMTVGNSLVDFYAKCGCMVTAQKVFDSTSPRSLATWGALIAGYSRQGDAERVFQVFEKMKEQKVKPDGIIFLSILTVCSHVGLVEAGKEVFETMHSEYGICPQVGHYNCLVDLLSRANRLEEAVKMVTNMPVEPDEITWTIVLNAARKWRNVEVGKLAFESLEKTRGLLSGDDDTDYVLMSEVYASFGPETDGTCSDEAWWFDKDARRHVFRFRV